MPLKKSTRLSLFRMDKDLALFSLTITLFSCILLHFASSDSCRSFVSDNLRSVWAWTWRQEIIASVTFSVCGTFRKKKVELCMSLCILGRWLKRDSKCHTKKQKEHRRGIAGAKMFHFNFMEPLSFVI